MMGWIVAFALYVLGACQMVMTMRRWRRLGLEVGGLSWVLLWPLRVVLLLIIGREDGE